MAGRRAEVLPRWSTSNGSPPTYFRVQDLKENRKGGSLTESSVKRLLTRQPSPTKPDGFRSPLPNMETQVPGPSFPTPATGLGYDGFSDCAAVHLPTGGAGGVTHSLDLEDASPVLGNLAGASNLANCPLSQCQSAEVCGAMYLKPCSINPKRHKPSNPTTRPSQNRLPVQISPTSPAAAWLYDAVDGNRDPAVAPKHMPCSQYTSLNI